MPRTPRLDAPGARHHVMNRTTRREAMFLHDDACALFVDTLEEVPVRFGARIHGYALMPNHYHLMVEVPRGNLSDVMKHIGAVFTQAFNRQHHHDGPVFRGRFKNEIVDDDAYWMHLLAYLHLNPVKARLAKRPEDCVWTSHLAYLDSRQRPRWLTTDELIGMFGSVDAVVSYIEDVRLKRHGPPTGFDPDAFWSTPSTREAPSTPAPEPRTPEQALEDVARVLDISVDAVLERKRGRAPNLGAWLAAWWLQRGADESQAAVARRLGVSRPRVSQLQSKLLKLQLHDATVADAMDELLRTAKM